MVAPIEGHRLRETFEADPLAFSRVVLGRHRIPSQVRMRQAFETERRVHLCSGNSMGKTHELAAYVIEWLARNKGGRVICTGPTEGQVKRGLWQEVRKAFRAAEANGVPIGGRMGALDWVLGDGWDAAVISVDNISAIQGARGRKCLIVVDEAQGVEDVALWDALESLMTAEDSQMIVSGNPLVASGRFFEFTYDPDWFQIQLSAFDHPNVQTGEEVIPGAVTLKWVEEKRKAWGEDSPQWQARVMGVFPDAATNQILTRAMLRAALDRDGDPVQDVRRIGFDVARFGQDASVLGVFDETRTLEHVEHWQGADLMESAGRVRQAMARFNVEPENVKVDACGMGAGVVDRLAEDGIMVDAVDFGEQPQLDWDGVVPDDTGFTNRRAELHWVSRQLVRERELTIPERFREVWADLVVPTYTFDGKGRIKVEDKESIRKRVGRSPDFGDMVHIAMSNAGAREPQFGVFA